MKLKLICCEVLKRETQVAIEKSTHQVDVEYLPKGLHDVGAEKMLKELQQTVDHVSGDYDYILLGYALCNNGVNGLQAKKVPLIIPRAHDCITLFLGSRERYNQYFHDNPGVYYHTSGWLEYAENSEMESQSISTQLGMDKSYQELVDEYGEDNAQYIYETLCQTTKNYHQFTYIDMGIEPDDRFEQQSRALAEKEGWQFETIQGDMSLFERLLQGPWNDDFLIVQPGEQIETSHDDGIVRAVSR